MSFENKQESLAKNFPAFCHNGIDLSSKMLGKLILTSGG